MPAPHKNQNAVKPASEKAESFLHARVKRSDKRRWVKAARASGGLAAWVVSTLNRAAPDKK